LISFGGEEPNDDFLGRLSGGTHLCLLINSIHRPLKSNRLVRSSEEFCREMKINIASVMGLEKVIC
jgi:hypothetical protein